MTDKMRERFEKWAVPHEYRVSRSAITGLYEDDATHDAWNGYQAAKADELAFLESLAPSNKRGARIFTDDGFMQLRNRIAELKKGETK